MFLNDIETHKQFASVVLQFISVNSMKITDEFL